jgi:hypothetical protein
MPAWTVSLSDMVATVQQLNGCSFFFRPARSVPTFLALALQVCRNRFGCHSRIVAEASMSKLSNFGHSL